jgi:hypothetical protein
VTGEKVLSSIGFEPFTNEGTFAAMLLEELILIIENLNWNDVLSGFTWKDLNDEVFGREAFQIGLH